MKKVASQKNLIIFSKYEKERDKNKKAFIRVHKNKDKSISRWGISKQGHKFYEKVLVNPKEKTVKKVFNDFKKQKNRKTNNVTAKIYRYTGRYIAKTRHISGITYASYYFNIDKIKERKDKNGLLTVYTTNVQEMFNLLDSIQTSSNKINPLISDE